MIMYRNMAVHRSNGYMEYVPQHLIGECSGVKEYVEALQLALLDNPTPMHEEMFDKLDNRDFRVEVNEYCGDLYYCVTMSIK